MIICASNRPEVMDGAVCNRLGFKVEFPLPDRQSRKDQLNMHIKKIFGNQVGTQVKYDCLRNDAYVTSIAERLEGCSGRTIQKCVNRLRQVALAENTLTITPERADRVIKQLCEQAEAEKRFTYKA